LPHLFSWKQPCGLLAAAGCVCVHNLIIYGRTFHTPDSFPFLLFSPSKINLHSLTQTYLIISKPLHQTQPKPNPNNQNAILNRCRCCRHGLRRCCPVSFASFGTLMCRKTRHPSPSTHSKIQNFRWLISYSIGALSPSTLALPPVLHPQLPPQLPPLGKFNNTRVHPLLSTSN